MPNFSIGSMWRRWDLHFHTPSSAEDYGNKSVNNEQIIEGLLKARISAVAVTDHHLMDTERIASLQELGGDQITVFPGIEIRTELGGSPSVHIIGIFPENKDLDDLWRALSVRLKITEMDVKRRGSETIYCQFVEAATVIHDLGGLVSVHAGRKSNSIESITNAEDFKRQIKVDLARDYIDILEVGKKEDEEGYKTRVLPEIGFQLPIVAGSDNHNILHYTCRLPCWIRADTTFEGLRQITHEPEYRLFLGEEPPLLERFRQDKTKFIKSVSIKKSDPSFDQEDWFDCSTEINPGLVAIIGNKGSGKSALAETIGFLGDTSQYAHFSFIHQTKFNHKKSGRGKYFQGILDWESGSTVTRTLNEPIPQNAFPSVVSIPQHYLESICTEVASGSGGKFDEEVKSVIFSHLSDDQKLGKNSFDELLHYHSEVAQSAISSLRKRLTLLNKEICSIEDALQPETEEKLKILLERKEAEIESLEESEPEEVLPPQETSTDPDMKSNLETLNKEKEKLTQLQEDQENLLKERVESARRRADAQQILGRVDNFREEVDQFKQSISKELAKFEIGFDDVITVSVNTDVIRTLQSDEDSKLAIIQEQLDDALENSIPQMIQKSEEKIIELETKVSEPQKRYEDYQRRVHLMEEKKKAIRGDKGIVDSIANLKHRLEELKELPSRLNSRELERLGVSKQIYERIDSLSKVFEELYQPLRAFAEAETDTGNSIHFSFRVNIETKEMEDQFLKMINKSRKGSFSGDEEGRNMLKGLLSEAGFMTWNDTQEFITTLFDHLRTDKREGHEEPRRIQDQISKGVSVEQVYDYVFSLEFLEPKYTPQWEGKDLDKLSPGERGTLLLVFYLMVDKRDCPLIIDQPEENLDNETVYKVLVPCLKVAKKRRQVIIVTHNPNMAVVCDADQVIYAEIDKTNRCRVTYSTGAIENPKINKKLVDVLEGTRPAFDNRGSKYLRTT